MEYIKQLLREKEVEIEDLTKDLESLMKENIKLTEKLSVTQKVLERYSADVLQRDLKIQELQNSSAEWLTTYRED